MGQRDKYLAYLYFDASVGQYHICNRYFSYIPSNIRNLRNFAGTIFDIRTNLPFFCGTDRFYTQQSDVSVHIDMVCPILLYTSDILCTDSSDTVHSVDNSAFCESKLWFYHRTLFINSNLYCRTVFPVYPYWPFAFIIFITVLLKLTVGKLTSAGYNENNIV